MKGKNVALVLSSGAARGLAQIGVIEVLLERGYTISSISGSSIGSIIGGAYVSGNLQEFTGWMRKIEKLDVLRLMDFIVSKQGLIKGDRVLRTLKNIFEDTRLEDLPIPLTIVGTDITSHQEVIFESGSLYDAIRASIAMPTIFTPAMIDGNQIVDGGVINPFPINCLKVNEGDLVIGVNLNSHISYDFKVINHKKEQKRKYVKVKEFINEKWSDFFTQNEMKSKKDPINKNLGFFDLLTNSMWILQERITDIYIERYNPDLVINISRSSADIFNFYRADELISYGRKQAVFALDEFEQRQNENE